MLINRYLVQKGYLQLMICNELKTNLMDCVNTKSLLKSLVDIKQPWINTLNIFRAHKTLRPSRVYKNWKNMLKPYKVHKNIKS